MSQPHLVVIGYVWPEPSSSAAGENMLNLLLAFVQRQWTVSFLTAASDSIHKADLAALGIDAYPIALNNSSFDSLISQLRPDAVVFDRFMIEEQFSWRVRKNCPDAMHILNTEDLHSLRHSRQQAIKQHTDATPDFYDPMTQREMAAILRCDLTLIISAVEYTLLTDVFNVPVQQLIQTPLLLSPLTDRTIPDFNQRSGFVFIGNYRHAPNWDAALKLKQVIWPQIRRQLKHATLHLYGAYPAKKVTDLHNPRQGFMVEGWAQDARASIMQHKVMLAPLQFGAGVKGKLLTAMQCQTPSVTTPVGAEGIADACHWPGAVCTTDDDLVAHSVALYENPGQWQAQADKAQQILHRHYNTAQNQQTLVNHCEALMSTLSEHRRQLFMQQLLWNETLRSNQYMSQWIEAKNTKN
ncbi:glycosyltransferase [Salinimonas lutimaris]|uniref:glycosyltransferase n=1 Tax=Salinimonas lutimaris TaxID=914153 RepID=UPI001E320C59|nr:glycosyltransferase [Salinimonas lutimaris]